MRQIVPPFSFGGFFDYPAFFRLGLIGHFDSPLAQNIAARIIRRGGCGVGHGLDR